MRHSAPPPTAPPPGRSARVVPMPDPQPSQSAHPARQTIGEVVRYARDQRELQAREEAARATGFYRRYGTPTPVTVDGPDGPVAIAPMRPRRQPRDDTPVRHQVVLPERSLSPVEAFRIGREWQEEDEREERRREVAVGVAVGVVRPTIVIGSEGPVVVTPREPPVFVELLTDVASGLEVLDARLDDVIDWLEQFNERADAHTSLAIDDVHSTADQLRSAHSVLAQMPSMRTSLSPIMPVAITAFEHAAIAVIGLGAGLRHFETGIIPGLRALPAVLRDFGVMLVGEASDLLRRIVMHPYEYAASPVPQQLRESRRWMREVVEAAIRWWDDHWDEHARATPERRTFMFFEMLGQALGAVLTARAGRPSRLPPGPSVGPPPPLGVLSLAQEGTAAIGMEAAAAQALVQATEATLVRLQNLGTPTLAGAGNFGPSVLMMSAGQLPRGGDGRVTADRGTGERPAGRRRRRRQRVVDPEVDADVERGLSEGAPFLYEPAPLPPNPGRYVRESVRIAREHGHIDARGRPIAPIDAAIAPHARAPDIRAELGSTGTGLQSAHGAASNFFRDLRNSLGLPFYDREAAHTFMLERIVHNQQFDRHWKIWSYRRRQQIRASGSPDFRVPLREVLDAHRRAVRQIADLPRRQRATMEWLIEREFEEIAGQLPNGLETLVPLPVGIRPR